jgi:DNA invertase Pin-like site-specific DNA recombinase
MVLHLRKGKPQAKKEMDVMLQSQTYASYAAPAEVRTAAMYVRMSTDHQKYSTENQADAIQTYAQLHNIKVIESYKDAGKSGLSLDGRNALKRLIDDVQSGRAEYSMILVLDVTRWGRFQDADESAYYEYICRRAGIDVQYIAEQFENDGSPVSTIVKGVKRAMAGEYSRELSAKVFAGQSRLILKGFRQGSTAGYGLRRVQIDEHGTVKGELNRKEYKSFTTNRIILVPGPREEVEIVRWIYRSFIHERISEIKIANILNERGILNDHNRIWTGSVIRTILTSEKYIGNNVYNRYSTKLKKPRTPNAPEKWVRADGAFEAIIDPESFAAVQKRMEARSRKLTDEELISLLRELYAKKGMLTRKLINEAPDLPTFHTFVQRFGGILPAFEKVGYVPPRRYAFLEVRRRIGRLCKEMLLHLTDQIRDLGGIVVVDHKTSTFTLHNEITVRIAISTCKQWANGKLAWVAKINQQFPRDITLVVRLNTENQKPIDYYLIPSLDSYISPIRFFETNNLILEGYRCDSLDKLIQMSRRVQIKEARA